jgi:hypothetical protein
MAVLVMTLVLARMMIVMMVVIMVMTAIAVPIAAPTIGIVVVADGRARRAAQGTADDRALGTAHVCANARTRSAANGTADHVVVVAGESGNRQQECNGEEKFAHGFDLMVAGVRIHQTRDY